MTMINLLRTDFMKQKGGFIWLFLLIIPLGTTAAMFLDMYLRYEDYLYQKVQQQGTTSWHLLLGENHFVLGWGAFLPVFVAVIAALVHHVEFKQQSWKSLLSLPVPRGSVFISKFFMILLFSSLLIMLNTLGLVLVGKLSGFPEGFTFEFYSSYVLYQFLGILGVAALHNWLSSCFKNAVYPVVIAFVGMIATSIVRLSFPEKVKFIPYSYAYYADGLKENDPMVALYGGLIAGILILVFGIIEFKKRDIV
ncbi:ABC transporter permease [Pseudalkalibacillus caeni]|uniref:ABC transporter permease n=1 Tax=Exobacillus caeni TaxID=2574798 RepID=A0A5R9F214_9BACL|nr:ABC transporter permease [Pseudalkalibacillus caeni]TLS37101.1 hypothetical protein FCL54_11270 [Pseudalkalibacillus caeni]